MDKVNLNMIMEITLKEIILKIRKEEKENIILTTTIPVPVISATSQVILQRIVHMQKILHKC